MIDRLSPIQVLEAIIDEVDGLRRTDARSFLPFALMQTARATVAPVATLGQSPSAAYIRHVEELAGHTIAHVFEGGLKHGDIAFVTTDGSFLVIEAEGDGDDASISTVSTYGASKGLAYFVDPLDLMRAGLIPKAEAERLKAEEVKKRAETAQQNLDRAKFLLEAAQQAVDALAKPEAA